MRKRGILIFVLFLFSSSAYSGILGIKVTGTVASSTIESIEAGDLMVGYCSYSLDAVDQNPSAYKGEYELISMVMQIGGYVFSNSTQNPTLEMWVTDECYLTYCGGGKAMFGNTLINESSTSITLFDLGNFHISRENDLIPTSMPDISFFTGRNSFYVGLGDSIGNCSGELDSIEVIPEPCSFVLLGLGVIGVLRRRRL